MVLTKSDIKHSSIMIIFNQKYVESEISSRFFFKFTPPESWEYSIQLPNSRDQIQSIHIVIDNEIFIKLFGPVLSDARFIIKGNELI